MNETQTKNDVQKKSGKQSVKSGRWSRPLLSVDVKLLLRIVCCISVCLLKTPCVGGDVW